MSLSGEGSPHHSHRGDRGHNNDADIRHLAYHLANYIHKHFVKGRDNPIKVSIVAHSMGAIVTRYALAMAARGEPGFPPVFVNDVVLAGGPHRGSINVDKSCGFWSFNADSSGCTTRTTPTRGSPARY